MRWTFSPQGWIWPEQKKVYLWSADVIYSCRSCLLSNSFAWQIFEVFVCHAGPMWSLDSGESCCYDGEAWCWFMELLLSVKLVTRCGRCYSCRAVNCAVVFAAIVGAGEGIVIGCRLYIRYRYASWCTCKRWRWTILLWVANDFTQNFFTLVVNDLDEVFVRRRRIWSCG